MEGPVVGRDDGPDVLEGDRVGTGPDTTTEKAGSTWDSGL
jgi:hypothetical protein